MTVPTGLKKAAVLCVLRSERGLLLLRRTKDPHIGKYIPIGGKIEPFETPLRAAIREVAEETGLHLEAPRMAGIMTETSPTSFNWINYVFTCDVEPVDPPTCEEGVLEWVPDSRRPSLPAPTTDRFIYDCVARSQFFVFDAVYAENMELLSLQDEISGVALFGTQKAEAAR